MNDHTVSPIAWKHELVDPVKEKNDHRTATAVEEAESFVRAGPGMLERAQRRMHELEAEMARLRAIIGRLEALRDG